MDPGGRRDPLSLRVAGAEPAGRLSSGAKSRQPRGAAERMLEAYKVHTRRKLSQCPQCPLAGSAEPTSTGAHHFLPLTLRDTHARCCSEGPFSTQERETPSGERARRSIDGASAAASVEFTDGRLRWLDGALYTRLGIAPRSKRINSCSLEQVVADGGSPGRVRSRAPLRSTTSFT